MPWYCGYCGRWHPERYRVCPTCGRPRKGRVCLKCKESVPTSGAFCIHCGSGELSEPGGGGGALPIPARLGILAAALLSGALLVRLLLPLLRYGVSLALCLFWGAAVYGALFWVVTGLLPDPWGTGLRRAARGALRLAGRLLRGIFRA